MSLFLDGLGAIFKKATEWIPSKSEKLRKERKDLQNEIDAIMRQPMSVRDNLTLHKRAKRLSQVEDELVNIAK